MENKPSQDMSDLDAPASYTAPNGERHEYKPLFRESDWLDGWQKGRESRAWDLPLGVGLGVVAGMVFTFILAVLG